MLEKAAAVGCIAMGAYAVVALVKLIKDAVSKSA